MKKLITILVLTASTVAANAQFTGKPIYNIRVERVDTLIGNIEVELFPNIAPLHAFNFDSIVNLNAFDSSAFHRVISGFMIQGGELVPTPSTNNINAEFSEVPHDRGILSAARAQSINSATSQFFICHAGSYWLDGNYSVYGQTISGMDVVDVIANAPTDANDGPLVRISMFITKIGSNDSVPAAPGLVSPADGITGVTSSQTFTWSHVTGAKLYLFEVATDTGFTNVVYSRETKNLSSSLSSLTDSYTNHYWRVRANNGGHYSAGGEVRVFANTMGTPTLLTPTIGASTQTRPNLDWSDVGQADEYHLVVSTSSNFGNPNLTVVDTVLTASQFKSNPHFQKFVKHYWKVTAMNASGSGDESVTFNFTPTTDSDDFDASISSADLEEVLAYPNPATNSIRLQVESPSKIRIYDSSGKLVQTAELNTSNIEVDIRQLKKGVYTFILNSKSGASKGSFVKE